MNSEFKVVELLLWISADQHCCVCTNTKYSLILSVINFYDIKQECCCLKATQTDATLSNDPLSSRLKDMFMGMIVAI